VITHPPSFCGRAAKQRIQSGDGHLCGLFAGYTRFPFIDACLMAFTNKDNATKQRALAVKFNNKMMVAGYMDM
jgi:hypothetical protein